jgi:hypothetical protein
MVPRPPSSDHAYVMEGGKIAIDGPAEELLKNERVLGGLSRMNCNTATVALPASRAESAKLNLRRCRLR